MLNAAAMRPLSCGQQQQLVIAAYKLYLDNKFAVYKKNKKIKIPTHLLCADDE